MEQFEVNKQNIKGTHVFGVGVQSYTNAGPGTTGDTYIYSGPSSENSILFGSTNNGTCFGTTDCISEFTKSAEITKKGSIYTSSGFYIGPNLQPGEVDRLTSKYQFRLKYQDSNNTDTILNGSTGINQIGGLKTQFGSETEFTNQIISKKAALFNKVCLGVDPTSCTDLQTKMSEYDQSTQKLNTLETNYKLMSQNKIDRTELSTLAADIKRSVMDTIYFSSMGLARSYNNGERFQYSSTGGNTLLNSTFIVPQRGLYYIQASASVNEENGSIPIGSAGIVLKMNSTTVAMSRMKTGSTSSMIGITASILREFNQGDAIFAVANSTVPMFTYSTDQFYGYMVKAL